MHRLPPIAAEDYKKIIQTDQYYVDKTLLVKDILESGQKNIFLIQPYLFGKSVTISMLKYFLEDTGNKELNQENKALFVDKFISKEVVCQKELCSNPVINLLFYSDVDLSSFTKSRQMLMDKIGREFKRHDFVKMSLQEKDEYELYSKLESGSIKNEELLSAIPFLSRCLSRYYHKKSIVLIDDCYLLLYFSKVNGYYDEMNSILSELFRRITEDQEDTIRLSVFTGTPFYDIKDLYEPSRQFDHYFGFTEKEMKEILHFYKRDTMLGGMKRWCGGYRGNNREETFYPTAVVGSLYTVCVRPELVDEKEAYPFRWCPPMSMPLIIDLMKQRKGLDDFKLLAFGNPIHKKCDDQAYRYLVDIGWLNIVKKETDEMYLELPNEFTKALIKMQLGYDS